ncbi:Sialidase precursor [Bremerella volcania]|uniref:exo-alpha-sialidase n=1 Tax=Bremerella volcania TaxID=2527984 RepID=A0A518C9K6_9BACT|nr:sialidase family protein [Bremerella volcania]QDU75874.1 Sialidase precursor [Bremerella volcania]
MLPLPRDNAQQKATCPMSSSFSQRTATTLLFCGLLTLLSATRALAERPLQDPPNDVRAFARPHVVPVLVRNRWNVVLELTIHVELSQASRTLQDVELSLGGSLDLEDIEKVDVIASTLPQRSWTNVGNLNRHQDLSLFGDAQPQSTSNTIHVRGSAKLQQGVNHFFVSVKITDQADMSKTLQIECPAVTIDGQTHQLKSTGPTASLRLGYALRRAGDDGVHTYRIPGLATTKAGSLIAVYDVRYDSNRDLPADIDVGMSRSVDGGRSWEPMRIIMDMGNELKWHGDGIGDPTVLVDPIRGTIWVAAIWSHGNRAWRHSGPGLRPEETGQFVLVRSDDDGKTWSNPINITNQVKDPQWNLVFNGPGKGICLQDGTLVFPAQFQDKNRVPHSTIVYSLDRGRTWKIGTGAHLQTTEAQVVEYRPGELMLNCRYNLAASRVVMTTKDLGASWEEHPSSQKALIEPRACMASLIAVDEPSGDESTDVEPPDRWLLFSNPNSTRARENITIKASSDGGHSWPQAHQLLLDQGRGAGYSCMTMIDKDTIGILYEGSTSQLVFQRIPLLDVIETSYR